MFFILIFIWIILSGKLDVYILFEAVIFASIVEMIAVKTFKDYIKLRFSIPIGFILFIYLPTLIVKMYKSSISLIMNILNKNSEAIICEIEIDKLGTMEKIVLAISITLTPGTIYIGGGEKKLLILTVFSKDEVERDVRSMIRLLEGNSWI